MAEEHFIHIESTQVWHGCVEPGEAELLTGDKEKYSRFAGEKRTVSYGLEFHKETKLTFECECGERFRKGQTAREHLEEYANE